MSVGFRDSDHGWKEVMGRLKRLVGARTLVGIRGKQGKDLVRYAAANEFGVRGRIPERSFLRSTIDGKRAKYVRILQDAALKISDGGNAKVILGIIGAVVVGDVQVGIRNRIPPPNAPLTIAKKGSNVPLIDTGRMRQSIDHTEEVG